MAYLTGDAPSGACELVLDIPNDRAFRLAVIGALSELLYPHNWQQFGDLTPADAVSLWIPIFDSLQLTCQEAATMEIVIGSYTGNGSATQAVTGVGFSPDILFIHNKIHATHAPWLATTEMASGFAKELGTPFWYLADMVISLDSDGFTVGDGSPVGNRLNVSGYGYSYIAISLA